MALRVAQSNAPGIGRSLAASPGRFSLGALATCVAVLAALWLAGMHVDLSGAGTTGLLCLALLVFGLPHGSLDIAVMRRSAAMGRRQVGLTVVLYLGLAVTMYVVWCVAPVVALASFLVIASVHFADDWADEVPPFFAIGTAVAVLAAPAMRHHQAITDIFMSLTGRPGAATIADLLVLIAPVALIASVTGIGLMVSKGRAVRAFETGAVLGGMLMLPPIAGFAIFFCLSHSPKHLAAARAEVRGRDAEGLAFTCIASVIAALIYAARGVVALDDGAIFATFVTLSILTVPHMIVPRIVKR